MENDETGPSNTGVPRLNHDFVSERDFSQIFDKSSLPPSLREQTRGLHLMPPALTSPSLRYSIGGGSHVDANYPQLSQLNASSQRSSIFSSFITPASLQPNQSQSVCSVIPQATPPHLMANQSEQSSSGIGQVSLSSSSGLPPFPEFDALFSELPHCPIQDPYGPPPSSTRIPYETGRELFPQTNPPNMPLNHDFDWFDIDFPQFFDTSSLPLREETWDWDLIAPALRSPLRYSIGGGLGVDVGQVNPPQFSQLYTTSQRDDTTPSVTQSTLSSSFNTSLQINQSESLPSVVSQAAPPFLMTNQSEQTSSWTGQTSSVSSMAPSPFYEFDTFFSGVQNGPLIQDPHGPLPSPTEIYSWFGLNAPDSTAVALGAQQQRDTFPPVLETQPSISAGEPVSDCPSGHLAPLTLGQSFLSGGPSAQPTEALNLGSSESTATVIEHTTQVVDLTTGLDRRLKKKKRQKLDDKQRESTKQVRRQGACLRCRINKEKCDLEVPCKNCRKVLTTAKLYKQPCQKPSLHDIVPFRPGNSRAGLKHSVFPQLVWCSDDHELRTTYICQNFTFRTSHRVPTLAITCRRFEPGPNDVLDEPYEASDGEVTFLLTHSDIFKFDIDTRRMREALEFYAKECRPILIEDILTTASDDIYKLGLCEANRFVSTRAQSVVSHTLDILACVHLNFTQPIMVGPDTLGVSPVTNEKLTIHGKSPVPSVLDYQIDTLYIHHMESLMEKVSRGLKKLIFTSGKTSNWYEIFLAIFVLLVSLERVYTTQVSYLQRSQREITTNVSRYMISLWKASAKKLIYLFRVVLKGMIPFSPSWNPNTQKQVELDEASRTYIRAMSNILDERKVELSDLREEGWENSNAQPLAWLVGLFLED